MVDLSRQMHGRHVHARDLVRRVSFYSAWRALTHRPFVSVARNEDVIDVHRRARVRARGRRGAAPEFVDGLRKSFGAGPRSCDS